MIDSLAADRLLASHMCLRRHLILHTNLTKGMRTNHLKDQYLVKVLHNQVGHCPMALHSHYQVKHRMHQMEVSHMNRVEIRLNRPNFHLFHHNLVVVRRNLRIKVSHIRQIMETRKRYRLMPKNYHLLKYRSLGVYRLRETRRRHQGPRKIHQLKHHLMAHCRSLATH